MSSSATATTYTKKEVDHIWNSYNENLNALDTFEKQGDTKKKTLIENLRDSVLKLVDVGKIAIPQNQVANYVWTQLHERNIKYEKSHFYRLFSENHKRKYTKSVNGHNGKTGTHKHDWLKVKSSKKHGVWKQCDCGANMIDNIEYIPAAEKNTGDEYNAASAATQPRKISEAIQPTGTPFEIIDRLIEVSQNNIRLLKMVKSKCTIHKTDIKKQVAKCIDMTEEERTESIKNQVGICINAVTAEITALAAKSENTPKTLLWHINKNITRQLHALRNLNFRTSITAYEKMMAKFAVCIGYDQNDVADFLGITTKHMKLNVLHDGNTRNSVLKDLEWFGRCPNPDCGISLKDYCEDRIDQWQQGTPITDAEDFELEPLLPTGYQKQVIRLQKKIKGMI